MPAPSQEFIIAALKRSERRDDGPTQMGWRSADGRAFGVTKRDQGLHLFEFEPNGRMVLEGADGENVYVEWDGHAQAFGDPNGYMAAASAAGLDPENFVMTGAGYNDYTLYYRTLDEVASAIRSAVDENRRHDDVDRVKLADREFRRLLRRRYERQRIEFGLRRTEDHRQAVSEAHGLFKGLHSMLGPLPKETRDDIMSFMNAPSVETWSQVANYVIKGIGMTMWGAWSRVDSSAPRSIGLDEGWTTFPDPEVMRRAMIEVGSTTPVEEDAGWMYRGPRR
jgi:hypothetical protein